jgi:Asp-tRNA(Asn)/Glu-tRNA(Gln) amidotransferase A subunit family amidase
VPTRETGKIATTDSIQVGRLRRAGAIVVGKTNTPADGHIAITKNLLGPPSCNPWALDRSPGGSSGGAAAAVAARMVPWATASDGGGSIRIPATLTGTFGHKVRNTLCFPLLLHHFLLRHLPEGYSRISNLNHYVSAHLHSMYNGWCWGWWVVDRQPTRGLIPIQTAEGGVQSWLRTTVMGPITRCTRDAAIYLDFTAGWVCIPHTSPWVAVQSTECRRPCLI